MRRAAIFASLKQVVNMAGGVEGGVLEDLLEGVGEGSKRTLTFNTR